MVEEEELVRKKNLRMGRGGEEKEGEGCIYMYSSVTSAATAWLPKSELGTSQ